MAKSVLDIVIRTIKEGGADKETVQGLVSVKSAIMNAAAVGGTLVTAGYAIKKAFDETVGTLVQYADQVRTVQNATGARAEDASKLIQILDDQKISYEQLEKAIAKSGKAYDFSIAGIASMSDAYLKLGTEQERAAFMQERFGKSWIDFVPIMQQGKQSILDQADAVSKGLVITQDAVDQAREYEIALDNWNDSVMALKVSIGSELLPALTNLIKDHQSLADTYKELTGQSALVKGGHGALTEEYKAFTAQVERGVAMTKFYSGSLKENKQSLDENAQAAKETTAAHQSMLGLVTSISNENKNYADKQAELTVKMQENRAEAALLYPWQKQQLDELNQKYVDMQGTYAANAEAHAAAMGKIQYDLFITKISADGITEAEFAMAQQAGLMFGQFDQASITAATSMNAVAAAVQEGKLRVEDMQTALDMLASGKYEIDVVLNTLQNYAQGALAMNGQSGYSLLAGNNGYAEGGISTGPASGHIELLHGTEAIIPLQSGSIPVQLQGGGGMLNQISNNYVYLTISSPVTIADQAKAQNVLLPYIINGIREAQSRGAIR